MLFHYNDIYFLSKSFSLEKETFLKARRSFFGFAVIQKKHNNVVLKRRLIFFFNGSLSFPDHLQKPVVLFNGYTVSSQNVAGDSGCAGSGKTIQHNITGICENLYQIPDESLRLFRRMHGYFFSLPSNGIAHNVFHDFLTEEMKRFRRKELSSVIYQP